MDLADRTAPHTTMHNIRSIKHHTAFIIGLCIASRVGGYTYSTPHAETPTRYIHICMPRCDAYPLQTSLSWSKSRYHGVTKSRTAKHSAYKGPLLTYIRMYMQCYSTLIPTRLTWPADLLSSYDHGGVRGAGCDEEVFDVGTYIKFQHVPTLYCKSTYSQPYYYQA